MVRVTKAKKRYRRRRRHKIYRKAQIDQVRSKVTRVVDDHRLWKVEAKELQNAFHLVMDAYLELDREAKGYCSREELAGTIAAWAVNRRAKGQQENGKIQGNHGSGDGVFNP